MEPTGRGGVEGQRLAQVCLWLVSGLVSMVAASSSLDL